MRLIQKRSKLTWHHLIIFGILFLISLLSFAQNSCKEVIGYYPNWQWYDRAKLVNPNSIDYSKYTIINYSFFDVEPSGEIKITDPWADKNLLLGPINWATAPAGYDGSYDFGNPAFHIAGHKFSDICHANNVKLLPSIGGWTLSSNFPAIATDPVKRQTFANSCVALIDAFGFDGIDIDWEYPGFVAHNGTPQDKANYTLFLQAIRTAIDNYGITHGKTMILTAAVGANEDRMDDVEWNNVSPILDAINLMSYDFFGAFDAQTNHNSPLNAPAQGNPTFNLTSAVDKLVNFYNVNPNKINAGVAFYGRSAKTVGAPGLHVNTTGAADLITFSEDDGTPLYYNIQKKMNQFNYNWDNTAEVPYLTGKNGLNTFLSYDDERAIGLKAEFIIDNNLRGAIIWEITGDYIETFPGSGVILNTPLADTLNNVLCNYSPINNQPPTITCPNNMTVQSSNGVNTVLQDYTNIINVLLNCSTSTNFSITQYPVAGTSLPIGTTIVTTTVTDGCGNQSTCDFNVTVTNNSSLSWVFQPNNIAIDCSTPNTTANTGNATATSTCATGNVMVNYTDNIVSGSCVNSSTITRTWTATDGCGNTIYHAQTIAITDNIAPTITCPVAQSLSSTNGSTAVLPNFTSLATVSDNCSNAGNIIITQSPSSGSNVAIGTSAITLTATDECGNSNSCSFNVSVSNGSTLVWTNQPGHLNLDCSASLSPTGNGTATATSTCGLGTVTINHSDNTASGSCANSSTITRTWTATDGCGNTIAHVQTITVTDNIAPEITCPSNQTLYSTNGSNAVLTDFSSQVTSTDNCSNSGDITFSQTPAVGTLLSLGNNAVSITATDECGNSETCPMTVEVISTVGILTNEKLIVTLFPNPFETNFTINFSQYSDYKIEVRDALGRLVEKIDFTGSQLNLNNYQKYVSGTYFVKVSFQDNDESQYYKIVKK